MLVNLITFVLGACVGSFLNVCIYRLPRNESVLNPPSHCPHCRNKISPWDNIPILSYFILRGKCRHCQKPISPRYPMVEILTALLYLSIRPVLGYSPFSLQFYLVAAFLSMWIIVFFADFETQIIPDELIYLGIPLGLLFNTLSQNLTPAVIGLVLGFSLFYFIGWAGKLVFKKEVLGFGDCKLAALLGSQLAWSGLLLSVFLAYLLSALLVSVLLLTGKVKWGSYVPFGPALAAGAAATLFFGPQLLNFYLAYFL